MKIIYSEKRNVHDIYESTSNKLIFIDKTFTKQF